MKKKVTLYQSKPGYDLVSSVYDTKENYLNSFEKRKLIPLLGEINNKKILDVGAGTGRISIQLAKHGGHVTSVDISSEMLNVLKNKAKHLSIETLVGDAESLPCTDSSFDIVVAAFLIVHLKNPKHFFNEVYRVLKDGGIFLVTNINQKNPPMIETPKGGVIIKSFYHRPDHIRTNLEDQAFAIEHEDMILENNVWINQIILARK